MANPRSTPLLSSDGICKDADALHDKQKIIKKQFYTSLFYSMSETFKFIGAATLAASLGILGVALSKVTVAAGASVLPAVTTALVGSPVGLAFLGAAALFTVGAIGSQFISSRFFHNATYDSLELNAQHTAKYLVKEIKKENACIAEQPAPARADGKNWSQYIQEQKALAQSQHQSL